MRSEYDFSEGKASKEIAGRFRELMRGFREPVSIGAGYRAAVEALGRLARDCAEPDWDGYQALPVDDRALFHAERFLDALPSSFPFPEVTADPDGEVSFDWFRGTRDLVTVCVSPSGRLSYAGIFGLSRIHGTEFLTDEIPEQVLDQIRRLLS